MKFVSYVLFWVFNSNKFWKQKNKVSFLISCKYLVNSRIDKIENRYYIKSYKCWLWWTIVQLCESHWTNLNACIHHSLFFHQMITLQKLWKMLFIFYLKSSFCSWALLYFWPPLFFTLSAIVSEDDRRKILKFMTSSIV